MSGTFTAGTRPKCGAESRAGLTSWRSLRVSPEVEKNAALPRPFWETRSLPYHDRRPRPERRAPRILADSAYPGDYWIGVTGTANVSLRRGRPNVPTRRPMAAGAAGGSCSPAGE